MESLEELSIVSTNTVGNVARGSFIVDAEVEVEPLSTSSLEAVAGEGGAASTPDSISTKS